MSTLALFILLMVLCSGGLFMAARLFQALDKRADQWPALWAMALGLSVLIPIMGLCLRASPMEALRPYTDSFAELVPLEPFTRPLEGAVFQSSTEGFVWSEMGLFTLGAIYLAGVIFCALRLIRGRRLVRSIVMLARTLGSQGGVEILLSRQATSPFAWSRLGRASRPFIVIPDCYARDMSPAQIEQIVRHEAAHLTRRDDEVGLGLRVLLCVCWISPFAHALFARWSEATELRCDMVVTATQSPEMRRAYAKTLMQALHIVAGRVRQYPAPAFSTPRVRTEKMRINHIMTGTRPAFKRRIDRVGLIAVAIGLSVTGTLGIAATATADTPSTKSVKAIASDIVTGRLTAKFGQSFDPFKDGKMRDHWGVDIAASIGTPIHAPAAGTIRVATDLYQNKPAYGTVVVIETENGVTTLFSHLDGYTVEEGQRVVKGELIATVGNTGRSTGPHVHIETYKDGERVDPMTVWNLSVK